MWGKERTKSRKRETYLIMLKIWQKLGEIVGKNTISKMIKLLVAKYLKIIIAFIRKNVEFIKLWRSKNYAWALFDFAETFKDFKIHIFVQVTHKNLQW